MGQLDQPEGLSDLAAEVLVPKNPAGWMPRAARALPLVWARRGAWLAAAAMLSAVLLSLWPLLTHSGWPANHESCVWATRMGVLKAAWHRGDWLPLWWMEGNSGLGSPMPGLYHKLQNVVATLLLELTGEVKRAQTLSLVLFSVLGCVGLRKLALQLGASPWLATLHALLLPFTSYATADWLLRGAFAEHAAFMLLPWLFVGLLDLIERGRVRVGLLCGTMVALFYAHSVTALFSVGLIVIATLLALARYPRRAGHILGKGVLAAAGFLLAIAPMVWATSILVQPFYLEHTVIGKYDVHRHLTTLMNALFLGEAKADFFVAPDPELWVAIAGATLLAVPRRLHASGARRWADPALAFILAGSALITFLRLEEAAPIYDAVPGLRYIQFPWRLLSFTTVLLLALSAALLGRIRQRLAIPLACAVLLVLVVRSRVFRFEDVFLPLEELANAAEPTHYVKWWEYAPLAPHPSDDWELEEWAQGPASLSTACSVHREGCKQCFVAECTAPGTIALPYAYSGLELVTDGAGRNVPAIREDADARVLVYVDSGRTSLRYRRPSWASVIRRLLLSH